MLTANGLKAVTGILLIAAGAAAADDKFPQKPLRMLVPFSAGSATDFFARLLGPKMTEHWGQQVVVDNRPSAGGVVASETLLAAAPDGYTLMLVSIGHAVNASLYSKLPYDPKRPLPRRSLDPTMSSPLEIYGQLQVKDCTARAETRLAILYLALRVFRLEKGSYPVTLSELVTNGYCKSLPDDPFAPRFGQSFGYRRELGDKITLWSCGPDGDDDNGRAIDAKRDGGKPRRYVQSGDEGDMVARVNTY